MDDPSLRRAELEAALRRAWQNKDVFEIARLEAELRQMQRFGLEPDRPRV